MPLVDMQHLQPHITLHPDEILNWGGNSERNVESLMMILLSSSLASLIPPFSESLTIFV